MLDELAFLRQMLEHREEIVPRLVYCDWLEEHGLFHRAEFIRIQIQLESADEEERKALVQRRDELKTHNWGEIAFGLPKLEGVYRFEAGLPMHCNLTANQALTHGEEIYAKFPIPHLTLRRIGHQGIDIAACTWLRQIKTIHFPRDAWFRGPDVAEILFSSHLTQLEMIDLHGLPHGFRIAEMMQFQNKLRNLRTINLAATGMNSQGVHYLCRSPSLLRVEELDLSNNPITDSAGLALTRCRFFKHLRKLNLSRPDHISKPMRRRLRRHFGEMLTL